MGRSRRDDDIDVMPEGSQEFNQTLHRVGARTAVHQSRHVGLPDPQHLPRLGLGECSRRDDAMDVQHERGLEALEFGVWEAKISEDVPTALFNLDSGGLRALGPHR